MSSRTFTAQDKKDTSTFAITANPDSFNSVYTTIAQPMHNVLSWVLRQWNLIYLQGLVYSLQNICEPYCFSYYLLYCIPTIHIYLVEYTTSRLYRYIRMELFRFAHINYRYSCVVWFPYHQFCLRSLPRFMTMKFIRRIINFCSFFDFNSWHI